MDTIVAISTPPGRGGIGIVRLSGPRAVEIAAPLLRLNHPLAPARARFGYLLDLDRASSTSTEPVIPSEDAREPQPKDPARFRPAPTLPTVLPPDPHPLHLEPHPANPPNPPVLDQIITTWFPAPHSYTGDDILEIAAHGAPVLLETIVRECCLRGARLAEPGEFTQRAFLAGRIDLTQAEAVHDLIASSTLEQARLAARQLSGSLALTIAPVKQQLVALIATLEAGIDFAEDDIDVLPAASIASQIAAIHAPLSALERTFAIGRVLRDGFSLAIVGRPNAGKSSLFNRLVRQDRAIVTATPGTTRDLVTETVAIDGIPVHLIDTAGLRESSDEAERLGIAKSHQAMADADLILLVIAAGSGFSEQDPFVTQRSAPGSLIVAYNKIDLVPDQSRQLRNHVSMISEWVHMSAEPGAQIPVVATSALTDEGIAELRAAIVRTVAGPAAAAHESGLLTNLRQHQAVAESLRALAAARAAVDARIPHEMLLLDLYAALRALDSLTGATTTEDVLALIFSTFCIGK